MTLPPSKNARPPFAASSPRVRLLDLDHVRAERAEDLGRSRACERARQVEHAHAGERENENDMPLIIATRVSARMRQVFESIVDAVSGSNWSYLIVFAIAMLDAFFPIVPSEATAIAAGVVAAGEAASASSS